MRRLRPSWPLGDRSPERSSSSGVPNAPPASDHRPPGADREAGGALPFGAEPCSSTPDGATVLEQDPAASTPARSRAPAATARGR